MVYPSADSLRPKEIAGARRKRGVRRRVFFDARSAAPRRTGEASRGVLPRSRAGCARDRRPARVAHPHTHHEVGAGLRFGRADSASLRLHRLGNFGYSAYLLPDARELHASELPRTARVRRQFQSRAFLHECSERPGTASFGSETYSAASFLVVPLQTSRIVTSSCGNARCGESARSERSVLRPRSALSPF